MVYIMVLISMVDEAHIIAMDGWNGYDYIIDGWST